MSQAKAKFCQLTDADKESLKNADGMVEIAELPELARAASMNHSELLQALHNCPVSRFFGKSEVKQNIVKFPLQKAR